MSQQAQHLAHPQRNDVVHRPSRRILDDILNALNGKSLVLVGMMGAGKSSIGRRLAEALGLRFVDSDDEIEKAANLTIPEIFDTYGEAHFREGERKVIARLLAQGGHVIALGGGAFENPKTQDEVRAHGLSIWLKADFETLMARVRRRSHRPLLKTADPEGTMRRLMAERDPNYAKADLTVSSFDGAHAEVVNGCLHAVARHFAITSDKTTQSHNSLPRYQSVAVELGERSYDIHIGQGLLATAGEAIAAIAPQTRTLIVTDDHVGALHLDALATSLASAGLSPTSLCVPAGETSKDWSTLQTVVDAVLQAKLERGDLVVALGGGVVGDLTGFAAAITRRGMRFVQIPTSLLAQVDSSVGGKTGINSRHGKNLVGAFHQPALVLADTDVLATLPERELKAGYAEVVKYGLIDEPDFFEWLEVNGPKLLSGDQNALQDAVARSCAAKARVVAADERESGQRALLNLGHTFGHALEVLNGYDANRLVHGEGVAIGMALAHRFSRALGYCPGQDVERVIGHLDAVGLPTDMRQIRGFEPTVDALVEAMKQDKKVSRGALTFILTRGIGQSFIAKDISEDALRDFLETQLS
ncbi:MAG: 3-dehydroquinate synthase [Pseudomonadota bacterium]